MLPKFCFVGFLLLAFEAQADLLVLDNGDRITGRLDSISGGKAIFDTSYAGRIWVEMTNVRTLETEEAYAVRVGDQVVAGTFGGAGDVQQLVADEQTTILLGERAQCHPESQRAE